MVAVTIDGPPLPGPGVEVGVEVVCGRAENMGEQASDTGPIDYLVVEFPAGTMTGGGMPLLLDLVERGLIRILDLAFVRKEFSGPS